MVETEEDVYYIRGGKKFRLYSPRCLESWSIPPIRSSESSVKHIPKARAPLGFRDGTLIHNMGDGRLYLISGNKRRQITSPDVFERFGWSSKDALLVSDAETKLHDEGEVIT